MTEQLLDFFSFYMFPSQCTGRMLSTPCCEDGHVVSTKALSVLPQIGFEGNPCRAVRFDAVIIIGVI